MRKSLKLLVSPSATTIYFALGMKFKGGLTIVEHYIKINDCIQAITIVELTKTASLSAE